MGAISIVNGDYKPTNITGGTMDTKTSKKYIQNPIEMPAVWPP